MRGAASLALRMGITPLVVGLTIVAIGTSSPELAVSLQAALEGNSDISIGNVVGQILQTSDWYWRLPHLFVPSTFTRKPSNAMCR